MKYYSFFWIVSAFFCLTACGGSKAEYDKLMEENAVLQQKMNGLTDEGTQLKGEYSGAIETLGAIDDSLNAIADRDKEIQNLTRKLEESKELSQKQSILSKLQALQNANDRSKDQAKQLQAKLNSFKVENEQLRKMIAQTETRVLSKEQELAEAQYIIDDLRGVMGKIEAQLLESQGELSGAYESLKKKNEELVQTNERLSKILADLKKKNNFILEQAKGLVVCGDKKQLRQKGILSKTSLKLAKDYHLAVKGNASSINYFEVDILECGGEGKIELILPERDPACYKIEGNKLSVKNSAIFWKTDKIVVLVKN
jgi:DNA repair exonuclease SbcCD ATPase subunit